MTDGCSTSVATPNWSDIFYVTKMGNAERGSPRTGSQRRGEKTKGKHYKEGKVYMARLKIHEIVMVTEQRQNKNKNYI